jgi:hypothetical protein
MLLTPVAVLKSFYSQRAELSCSPRLLQQLPFLHKDSLAEEFPNFNKIICSSFKSMTLAEDKRSEV